MKYIKSFDKIMLTILLTLLIVAITIYLNLIFTYAESVIAVTDKGVITNVENHYTPTDGEVIRLHNYVNNWYQRNKNASDKYYVRRAMNHISRIASYDLDYKNSMQSTFSPYTIFTTKKFVCMGYTMLFQKFLDRKGIPNICVHDTVKNHIYNRVLVGGEWQNIDLTKYDSEQEIQGIYASIKNKLNTSWDKW